jgi:hypothetical protein
MVFGFRMVVVAVAAAAVKCVRARGSLLAGSKWGIDCRWSMTGEWCQDVKFCEKAMERYKESCIDP